MNMSVHAYVNILSCTAVQVAIVRQTETVALRKASKSKSAAAASNTSSSTFSRDVAGVFSPGKQHAQVLIVIEHCCVTRTVYTVTYRLQRG